MTDTNNTQPAPQSWVKRNWQFLAWAFSTILGIAGGLAGGQAFIPSPPPQIVERDKLIEVPGPEAEARAQGWLFDPQAVEHHCEKYRVAAFADTPAGRAALAAEGDVYLWDAAKKVTGAVLPARDQGQVGSCVSFGTASAVEHLLCVQIASGRGGQYRDLAQEVIYAGSRVEVGGGKITGDGSIGAWAVEWVSRWGVIARAKHLNGKYDLTAYDQARCRSWGRSGVPDDLEAVAKESPVKGYALCASFAEADKAIRQGYPVVVCSGQGFTMGRDADGFCRASGTWYHCMAFIGTRAGKRPGLFCLNSWGPNAHTGPRFPADAPSAGFWVDANVADKMLRTWKDSFALSDAVGFPERRVLPDWFVIEVSPRTDALLRRPAIFARTPFNEVALSW